MGDLDFGELNQPNTFTGIVKAHKAHVTAMTCLRRLVLIKCKNPKALVVQRCQLSFRTSENLIKKSAVTNCAPYKMCMSN